MLGGVLYKYYVGVNNVVQVYYILVNIPICPLNYWQKDVEIPNAILYLLS